MANWNFRYCKLDNPYYHTPYKDSDIQSVLTKPKTFNRLNLIDLRNGPVPLEPFHTIPNTFRNCRKNHNFTSGLDGAVVLVKYKSRGGLVKLEI